MHTLVVTPITLNVSVQYARVLDDVEQHLGPERDRKGIEHWFLQ